VYARDKVDGGETGSSTTPDILLEIAAAHEGDAITDTALYSAHLRRDTTVFNDLYGLDYDTVLQLREYPLSHS